MERCKFGVLAAVALVVASGCASSGTGEADREAAIAAYRADCVRSGFEEEDKGLSYCVARRAYAESRAAAASADGAALAEAIDEQRQACLERSAAHRIDLHKPVPAPEGGSQTIHQVLRSLRAQAAAKAGGASDAEIDERLRVMVIALEEDEKTALRTECNEQAIQAYREQPPSNRASRLDTSSPDEGGGL